MEDYIQSRITGYKQKVKARFPKRKSLIRTIATLGVIGIGLGAIALCGLKHPNNYETISEKRERYLRIANEQLMQTQEPGTINGLNKVITDIENGVYDY